MTPANVPIKTTIANLQQTLGNYIPHDYLGAWRNRLAQESYTFKVGGSSPFAPTELVSCRSGRTVRTVNPVEQSHRRFESCLASKTGCQCKTTLLFSTYIPMQNKYVCRRCTSLMYSVDADTDGGVVLPFYHLRRTAGCRPALLHGCCSCTHN